MSANRAVQAAQRRRAGGPEPAPPGRGPQPSINSSQMFSQQPQQQQQQQQQQVRPGTSGRLAGQHAQQMQQQHQQQQMQDPQQPAAGIAGISKMTLAQAITLITLRLGKVETQLHEIGHQQMGMDMGMGMNNNGMMDENGENMALVDKGLIDSIMSRLESLEKRSPSTGTSSPDVALLKQQFDGIKMSFAQSTKVNAILTKEQKEHKQQIDALKSELSETKELLNALQTLTMDNSQKIFAIMSGEEVVLDADEDEVQDEGDADSNANADAQDDEDEDSELVGTDLKGLIEQELNA